MYSSSNKNQIWSGLEEHCKEISKKSLIELFNENPERSTDFSTSFGDLWVDISKQIVDSKTIQLLSDLAEESKINQFFEDMMTGSPVNLTEKNPALHTALRAPKDSKILVDGKDVVPSISESFGKKVLQHIEHGPLI